MNTYLRAPNNLVNYSKLNMSATVFLAGSITGASDWQQIATDALLPHFNVFNPRRENYPSHDTEAEFVQVAWENTHLNLAEIALFYFAPETVAPITLLEYGKQLVKCGNASYRKTYVAIHPNYEKRNNVLIQTRLENSQWLIRVHDTLEDAIDQLIAENCPKKM